MSSAGSDVSVSLVQTGLEQAKNDQACTDECCQDPPGFARAYWLGMAVLVGPILLATAVSALVK